MSIDIIPDFVRYQIEWLMSHNDLEFDPVTESALVRMLKDTGKSFIDEWTAETSQADHIAESGRMVERTAETAQNVQDEDLISRKAAIDAVEKSMYENPHENEIHRGMHDHEHRHFLTILMGLPSAQPATNCSEIPNGSDDTISRQAAIEALARMMPRSYTPDGSHPADEEIFRAQEVFADCIEALEILPPAQPDRDVIDDCLCHIYKNISVHTATGGVIAIRYYMEKLYEEIYGEGERPWWMK